jgi:aminobenzoyl-glutamate utilization protein B
MDYRKIITDAVDSRAESLKALSLRIHDNPETAYNEVRASRWMTEALRENGFEVETGLYGMPTSIRAVWGSGHPVIGLLAEYDALPGLSQKQSTFHDPAVPGGPGHGCGHDLLGTATLGAALAMKADLESSGLPGTVVFYGCPAEEVLTGKPFMARGGAFRELDLALAWHGGGKNMVHCGIAGGINSAIFHYKGKAGHASGAPWLGRSALDACELLSVGANYLREHIPDKARIHYSYKEAGEAPNIIPDRASVWYYVRGLSRESIEDIYGRLVETAEGAARMTGTELSVEFLGGCYNTHSNAVVSDAIYEVLCSLPPIEYTEEERAMAEALARTSENYDGSDPLPTEVEPNTWRESSGSFDLGDVQHIVPCGLVSTVTWPGVTGNHNWQATCCTGNGIGLKGMLQGAKVLALTAGRFYRDPGLLKAAKDEFDAMMDGKSYKCPIPGDVPVPQPTEEALKAAGCGDEGFLRLAAERWSVRKFEDRPVEKDDLEKILRAGQLAPTACNYQPQRVLVIDDPEAIEKLKACTVYTYGARTFLLTCIDHSEVWVRKQDGKDGGDVDAAIVTTHMMMEAADLGIGSVWVGSFDPARLREAFAIPDHIEPVALLPIGYIAADAKPSPLHEQTRPLSELVVYNRF